mmetsp:Transcript_30642/g.67107  ORF Transcript_30642/g.67107 Transcript_30642/m.67107 type:complete len:260 (+) Transcript_30642:337-1116(+)
MDQNGGDIRVVLFILDRQPPLIIEDLLLDDCHLALVLDFRRSRRLLCWTPGPSCRRRLGKLLLQIRAQSLQPVALSLQLVHLLLKGKSLSLMLHPLLLLLSGRGRHTRLQPLDALLVDCDFLSQGSILKDFFLQGRVLLDKATRLLPGLASLEICQTLLAGCKLKLQRRFLLQHGRTILLRNLPGVQRGTPRKLYGLDRATAERHLLVCKLPGNLCRIGLHVHNALLVERQFHADIGILLLEGSTVFLRDLPRKLRGIL